MKIKSNAGCQSRNCEFVPKRGQHFPDIWQRSMPQASFILIGLAIYVEKQPVIWKTGVRKSGNTWVGKLAAVIWLNFFEIRVKPQYELLKHLWQKNNYSVWEVAAVFSPSLTEWNIGIKSLLSVNYWQVTHVFLWTLVLQY